jgi:hypothetical protein
LLVPIEQRRHAQDLAYYQRLPAAGRTLEKQKFFLQVRCKIE